MEKNGFSADVEDLVEVEPPKQAEHGDFATNFCLVASKKLGQNPRALAEMLVEAIREADQNQLITEIDIAGPGFINFKLSATQVAAHIGTVLERAEGFGKLENSSPERINVEFVSVNPNGPITIGSGRGAAFGSALCNVLEAAGNVVHREYYINDGVNSEQMRLFAESVKAIILRDDIPADGYKGDYVKDVADKIAESRERVLGLGSIYSGYIKAYAEFFDPQISFADILDKFARLHNQMVRLRGDIDRQKFTHDNKNPFGEQSVIVNYWYYLSMDHMMSTFPNEANDSLRFVHDKVIQDNFIIALALAIESETQLAPRGALFGRPSEMSMAMLYSGVNARVEFMNGLLIDPEFKSFFKTPEYTDWLVSSITKLREWNASEDRKHALSLKSFTSGFSPEMSAAAAIISSRNDLENLYGDDIREMSESMMIAKQRADLLVFQVNFDTWFSEQSLHDSGAVQQELDHLIKSKVADDGPYRIKLDMAKGGVIKDVIREEQPVDEDDTEDSLPEDRGGIEGGVDNSGSSKTVWLRSTKFGDDQDRVLRRKDGRLTYIASDVAYHKDKFNRPADATKLITVLGPDHHGYIGRLTAVVAAMHADQAEPINNPEPLSKIEAKLYSSVEERNRCQASLAWAKEHLEVQIFQIVRFLKDGKPAPMRKRDGNIYALIDLVNEIGETIRPNGTEAERQQAGSDVARFFYLMRHHDTAMDFDLELATKQSDENPVFYVQYAHARISSVIEKAKEQGFEAPARLNNPGLLNHPKEIALVLKICDLPHEVERTAKDYSVNRLTTYAIELARTYHSFYDSCRVIQSDQPELTLARLALCQATRIALKNALNLLGVSAPERMDRTVTN
ncbi:MAG: hypothetical protein KF836_05530 [Fimbriimonadaceae bacterium]|nr:hypothetical protein [Fimbriimonadaceae bacterium]